MNSQKGFVIPLIIAIVAVLAIGGIVFVTKNKKAEAPMVVQNTATATKDLPRINSIYPTSGPIGTEIVLIGTNLRGYSVDVVIENSAGEKTYLLDAMDSSFLSDGFEKIVSIMKPSNYCQPGTTTGTNIVCSQKNIKPGEYSVYVNNTDKLSNRVAFTVTSSPVACTMDAMQCPDGSYVGRSAPDCKFICPNN